LSSLKTWAFRKHLAGRQTTQYIDVAGREDNSSPVLLPRKKSRNEGIVTKISLRGHPGDDLSAVPGQISPDFHAEGQISPDFHAGTQHRRTVARVKISRALRNETKSASKEEKKQETRGEMGARSCDCTGYNILLVIWYVSIRRLTCCALLSWLSRL
jgi:hypothetical protein